MYKRAVPTGEGEGEASEKAAGPQWSGEGSARAGRVSCLMTLRESAQIKCVF